MPLQYIVDKSGTHTAVMIPIDEWELIALRLQDLNELETTDSKSKKKLSELAGKLSKETADAMHKYVEGSRNDWDERLKKQL